MSDQLYKGLTRPATFAGVPATPLFLVIAAIFLSAFWFSFFLLFLVVPAFICLRIVAGIDDKIFNLIGLKVRVLHDGKKVKDTSKIFCAKAVFSDDYRNVEVAKMGIKLSDLHSVAPFIPYSSHVSNELICTKHHELVASWQCAGINFETVDDADLDIIKMQINTLLISLMSDQVSIYYHVIRQPKTVKKFGLFTGFASEINDLYFEKEGINAYENRLFFTLVLKTDTDKYHQNAHKNLLVAIEKMDEICNRVEKTLERFQAKRLGIYDETYSSQLEFYHFLLTHKYQKIRVLDAPIYNYLSDATLFFSRNTAEIVINDSSSFFRTIEIKEYSALTDSNLLDSLLYMTADYVLTQSFSVMPKVEAKKFIKLRKNQLASVEDESISQQTSLIQLSDELASGETAFGMHHFTLTVYAETQEKVTHHANELITTLNDMGFIATLATLSLEAGYYAQLPANFNYRPRLSGITALNFSSFMSFHNFDVGKKDNNAWGDAMTVLKTPSNAPYYLNLHDEANFGDKPLGHTLVLGSSGSGKTMLLSFLLNQMQKYADPQSFPKNSENKQFTTVFLDKDHGAEININALNGKYINVSAGVNTGFNPFQCENHPENVQFLRNFVKILVGRELSAIEEESIALAVESVLSLDMQDRCFGITRLLENLTEGSTLEDKKDSLVRRLRKWKKGEEYGWVFDNESDQLSFENCQNFGFDGTEFLGNTEISAAISFYILHRISALADGRRLVIVMDEFWMWLNDPSFKSFIYDGLKTLRKNNAVLIFATQSPDEIIKSSIARAVIEQVATCIYLPNQKADKDDYMNVFKLTEKEFLLLSKFAPNSRTFIVKKGLHSTIARLDLSSIGKANMSVLSASADNINIFRSIELKKDWLKLFKKQAI